MPRPLPLTAVAVDVDAGAETLFIRLFADAEAAFWLDAGSDAEKGWSILGTGEIEPDPDAVRAVPLGEGVSGDGPPFRGGWVGWLGYEDGAAALGAPAAGQRVSAWIAVTRAVAVDHRTGRTWLLATEDDVEAWAGIVRAAAEAAPAAEPEQSRARTVARGRDTAERYRRLVEECRSAIRRGDAYQLCLTTRFTVHRPEDPVSVYRRLRAMTPAHHGGLIRVGQRWLLSASPEQFLDVSGGRVRTSPIKGTRPRGATPEEDGRLAEELQRDEKERAENVMIVDLMRNDLSHIGRSGSLLVERLWQVETYPAVHQLVSTVSVTPREGVDFGALCDAAFPAGSMTGAPKLSAMTILHRLESGPRGIYSGCFGHVGLDGRVDLAMVIRSVVIDGDEAHVGAGGGITWLSRPDAEAAEVSTKARAPLAALGAELPADWAAL